MKKIFTLAILLFAASISFSQNITYQQKLYYTGKVWGFVKYYHSRVSTCQVNWDSVLVARLPFIKTAASGNDFNNELDTLLNAAGPMALATTSLPDTLPAALKRNRDFSWLNDPVFRPDIVTILDTIKNNFRPHISCWIDTNDYLTSNTNYLILPHDSLMFNSNISTSGVPSEANRLLITFKCWNLLNYFYPYKYALDKSWDSTLYNKILPVANAANGTYFYFALKKMAGDLDDAHVEGLTFAYYFSPPTYYYTPKLLLTYAENKYIVVKSAEGNIAVGDAISSVNGISVSAMEDSLRPYISAGNPAVFHRSMCSYLLNGYYNTTATIGYVDSNNQSQTYNAIRATYIYDSWFYDYYPSPDLKTVHWQQMDCNVGYINLGQFQQSDESPMYNTLQSAPAIIFDIRNYPNVNAYDFVYMMYANPKVFAKFTIPDLKYPGTFSWQAYPYGLNNNPTPYNGKVIILMNEQTQSAAEYTCMALEALPNVVKIGSQTAGADGNTTSFKYSQDLYGGFTAIGVYYPNGDSTQRIGIRPDIALSPTQVGIRHHRDDLMEKAMAIGCALGVANANNTIPRISVFPNPANDVVTVSTENISGRIITTTITDITGKELIRQVGSNVNGKNTFNIDVNKLAQGMYFLKLESGSEMYSARFVKAS